MSSSHKCFNYKIDVFLLTLIKQGGRFIKEEDFGEGLVTFILNKKPGFEVMSHDIIFDSYKDCRNECGVIQSVSETQSFVKIQVVFDTDYICPDQICSGHSDGSDPCTNTDDDDDDDEDDDYDYDYSDMPALDDTMSALDATMSNVDWSHLYGNYPENGDCRPLNLTPEEKVSLRQKLDDELDVLAKERELCLHTD